MVSRPSGATDTIQASLLMRNYELNVSAPNVAPLGSCAKPKNMVHYCYTVSIVGNARDEYPPCTQQREAATG